MTIGVVAVTGAASGIGLALACEAIERGYSVAAFDQNQPALASLQARLGPDRCRITDDFWRVRPLRIVSGVRCHAMA